jgi:hypothetical protein
MPELRAEEHRALGFDEAEPQVYRLTDDVFRLRVGRELGAASRASAHVDTARTGQTAMPLPRASLKT